MNSFQEVTPLSCYHKKFQMLMAHFLNEDYFVKKTEVSEVIKLKNFLNKTKLLNHVYDFNHIISLNEVHHCLASKK